ncbi:WYL domain-containing protein [Aldersonia sp. NBC_00410]|uniref:helix-turn-helix transcriptional regulator n=1 Tax=Aldersonia sp. NBC_00410 TaxID=2975954 RepID=UPI0022573CD9|nr:WYL domain-containing protein [Aldersonia sp. NBC_00410]MCX5045828.1 WYL domain-containing protein [Aldersonia sp. NBC_00410]
MAISKVERLMNLVIALLSTEQYLSAERIKSNVMGYEGSASDEAFSRMFERDKNELRDLGIPLQTGPSPGSTTPDGYRINRDAYELPEIDLTDAESAAVAVAVQLWESPELTSAAQSAVLKLRAAGVQVDREPAAIVSTVAAPSRGSEPALGKLLTAIEQGRAVRFEHRSSATDPFVQRDVEPWGIVTRNGRWYLVGFDRDRQAERTFRLSRIGDDVAAYGPADTVSKPVDLDLQAVVDRIAGAPAATGTATVWVAHGHAYDVRRLGTVVGTRRVGERDGDLVELVVRSRDWIGRMIAGHGADVLVVEPDELRTDVLARLRAAADRTEVAR